eukprot:gene5723-7257_t
MTISLTVILIESTDEITLGLPLMVTLMVAKWVGDYFNEGLYDIHIELKHIPLLGWDPSEDMKQYHASDIMSKMPICLYQIERVRDLIAVLTSNNHNGFPIVGDFSSALSPNASEDTLTDEELDMFMDFKTYMSPSPYTVWSDTSVSRVFNLFRTMGLRHLVVLDRKLATVVGIITRKNLAHLSEHEGRHTEDLTGSTRELNTL